MSEVPEATSDAATAGAAVKDTAPRPQHLIVTVFALFGRQHGGIIAIAEVIDLMSALGVDDVSVRSSVSRLKRRGVLESVKRGSVAAYRIAPELDDIFAVGDERIFHPKRATLGDPWVLASYSVPESERPLRHKLRTLLTRLGYGQVSPALWIAPLTVKADTTAELKRLKLTQYVELFTGDRVSDEPLKDAVSKWWDLEALDELYRVFVDGQQHLMTETPKDDATAFASYVEMITQWRRLPYLDPGLPIELLPDGWSGIAAEQLFTALHELLFARADRFASLHLPALTH